MPPLRAVTQFGCASSGQLARQAVATCPHEAAELLAQSERQAEEALQELWEPAHGIYPPVLADLGMAAALAAQARKAAIPVTVELRWAGTGRTSRRRCTSSWRPCRTWPSTRTQRRPR